MQPGEGEVARLSQPMRPNQRPGILQGAVIAGGRRRLNLRDHGTVLVAADLELDHAETAGDGSKRSLAPRVLGHAVRMQNDAVEISGLTAAGSFNERREPDRQQRHDADRHPSGGDVPMSCRWRGRNERLPPLPSGRTTRQHGRPLRPAAASGAVWCRSTAPWPSRHCTLPCGLLFHVATGRPALDPRVSPSRPSSAVITPAPRPPLRHTPPTSPLARFPRCPTNSPPTSPPAWNGIS